MSAPGYHSYRESAVDWNVRAPTHWTDTRLRFVAEFNPSKSEVAARDRREEVSFIPMDAVGDDGTIRLDQTRKVGDVETGYTYFADGDVTFAKITPCFENGKGAVMRGLQGGVGFGTTELTVARPTAGNSAEFLHWLFTSPPFRKLGEGSMYGAGGQKRVPDDFARDFRLALPSVAEQSAIAAFLNRETGKIDALVEAQRRLIELLKEKRQAVISHAVTKGLDPTSLMKDSGVEWLGDVPAHWEVSQSRRLFAVRSEPALSQDQMLTASQKHGVLFQSDFVEREGRRVVEVIMGKDSLRHVEPDDFIISMRSFQGGLEWSRLRGCTSFHYVMVTPIKWVHAAFFAYLFKSLPYIQALRSTTDLIRDGQEIRYSHFVKVPLPVVPVTEQHEIAEYLNEAVGKYDDLLNQSAKFIDILQERRSALISAAVTGKIDVRGLVSDEAEAA